MASERSVRHTVAAEMNATTPATISCRANSAQLQRDSGTPLVAGNSQASALISAFTEGGKDPGPAHGVPPHRSERNAAHTLSPQGPVESHECSYAVDDLAADVEIRTRTLKHVTQLPMRRGKSWPGGTPRQRPSASLRVGYQKKLLTSWR
jgi:hypothetical protein